MRIQPMCARGGWAALPHDCTACPQAVLFTRRGSTLAWTAVCWHMALMKVAQPNAPTFSLEYDVMCIQLSARPSALQPAANSWLLSVCLQLYKTRACTCTKLSCQSPSVILPLSSPLHCSSCFLLLVLIFHFLFLCALSGVHPSLLLFRGSRGSPFLACSPAGSRLECLCGSLFVLFSL